ncbi:LysR family transcriptional regulator [Sphingomonas sp. So64.6b]|uniref:LysR family transcriptional regulator n=1 Tax=Sphingomonas sp. So64.6b TaxID=2997354 RepID=UPI0016023A68|nr:LysR family transcriptional regulator [Sphingomonas sp. So64.6b]QNA86366.1 LysR family transcriptional regulator [Sphingomonas sp. So64.6b]
MFDWEDLRHFAAFADAGSLSAAARKLGVEHATVARRIMALEAALGTKLVDRRGRRLSLSGDGLTIASLARTVESSALAVARAATGVRSTLTGNLTISAPPTLASAILARPIVQFRHHYSKVDVTLLGEKRRSSLERLEADIAIRLGRPEVGDLIISKLGDIGFGLYGRNDYIAETLPGDWTFIGYDDELDAAPQQIALLKLAGRRPVSLRSSTLEGQLALVEAGGGVAMLPHFLAAPHAFTLAPAVTPIRREVWFVVHSDLRNSAVVRAASDLLRDELKQALLALPAGPQVASTLDEWRVG